MSQLPEIKDEREKQIRDMIENVLKMFSGCDTAFVYDVICNLLVTQIVINSKSLADAIKECKGFSHSLQFSVTANYKHREHLLKSTSKIQ